MARAALRRRRSVRGERSHDAAQIVGTLELERLSHRVSVTQPAVSGSFKAEYPSAADHQSVAGMLASHGRVCAGEVRMTAGEAELTRLIHAAFPLGGRAQPPVHFENVDWSVLV